MVSIDVHEIIRRLEIVLNREGDLESFISWFFDEHGRVASFQANQRIRGEATLEEQVAASRRRPESQILGELFMDLEEYRTEEERARGEIGLNEAELREHLKDRLGALRSCIREGPPADKTI